MGILLIVVLPFQNYLIPPVIFMISWIKYLFARFSRIKIFCLIKKWWWFIFSSNQLKIKARFYRNGMCSTERQTIIAFLLGYGDYFSDWKYISATGEWINLHKVVFFIFCKLIAFKIVMLPTRYWRHRIL